MSSHNQMYIFSRAFHGHAWTLFSIDHLDMEVRIIVPGVIFWWWHKEPKATLVLTMILGRLITYDNPLWRTRYDELRSFVHNHSFTVNDLHAIALQYELNRIFISWTLIWNLITNHNGSRASNMFFELDTISLANANSEPWIFLNYHGLFWLIPLVRHNNVGQNARLNIAMNKIETILVIWVLASQFIGKCNQLIRLLRDSHDSVFNSSHCLC